MAAELPALRSFLGPKFDPAQPISVEYVCLLSLPNSFLTGVSIVVVPGLRIFKDDLGALWTAPAWPERVFERLTNRQARLNAYEYSLWDDDGGIFTPKGARAEARKLLDFLTERRRGQLKVGSPRQYRFATRRRVAELLLVRFRVRYLTLCGHSNPLLSSSD